MFKQLATLLTGKPADDPDGLMNTCCVAETQLRVVLTLQHFVMLNERFTEQFKGPGVALEDRQALKVNHEDTRPVTCRWPA